MEVALGCTAVQSDPELSLLTGGPVPAPCGVRAGWFPKGKESLCGAQSSSSLVPWAYSQEGGGLLLGFLGGGAGNSWSHAII